MIFKDGGDKFNLSNRLEFDILGKHTHTEMEDFAKNFYINYPEYTEVAHRVTGKKLYEWVSDLLTEYIINHIENKERNKKILDVLMGKFRL